jgi:lipopolysaccharide export system protein LptA
LKSLGRKLLNWQTNLAADLRRHHWMREELVAARLTKLRAELRVLSQAKLLLAFLLVSLTGLGWGPKSCSDEISFSRPDPSHSISVNSESVFYWRQGSYEVLHLVGDVEIQQGNLRLTSNQAILWVDTPSPTTASDSEPNLHKVIVYMEGQTVVELPRGNPTDTPIERIPVADRIVDERWFGRLFTTSTVDLNRTVQPLGDQPQPEIYARAKAALDSGSASFIAQTGFDQQFVVSPQTGALMAVPDPNQQPSFGTVVPDNAQTVNRPRAGQALSSSGGDERSPFRVDITGRDGGLRPSFKGFTNPQNPAERIEIGLGGFRVTIESPAINQLGVFQQDRDRLVILLADSLVHWQTTNYDGSQSRQVYLEGNVVFSKGQRVITAERMFYDVESQRGTILDADIYTPVPSYQGLVRMRANMVQQLDENNLRAFGTAVTSSRMGVPRYWLQSGTMELNRQTGPALDPETGTQLFNPQTGELETEDEYLLSANQNRVYLADVPVFVWPRLRTSLNNPSMYLERFSINNDRIFGAQVRTGWDLYQILGWQQPKGREWIGVVDYLSERGLGFGTESKYQQDSFLGFPGVVTGEYKSWFIRDDGLDFLGRDRVNLFPEDGKGRGRIIARHRHEFPNDWILRGEIGFVSDRNFLEQFYEREWDTEKDATTGIWLERNVGTQSFNLLADYQINEFFTQTSWLPRFDHFSLGQSLFADRAVWHGHSHIGYGRMRVASTPTNPADAAKFDPLAWEADVEGVRAGTRQELDFPIQLGPGKVVPYLLGDLTFWQQDLGGNDVARGLGQVGIRTSLPIWKVDPSIQSLLWDVNGLAHKVNFEFEALYADATEDIDRFPLYDQLDDDAQEHFRRRFAFDTFGILPGMNVPLQYDERYFALRSGMQSNVTAPSLEIADDLSLLKFGVRQRWQTKRGMPGRERVVDWITLDAQTTFFPEPNRDNFGADFGLFNYDFAWYVGDRFSLESDGYLDFFSQGLRTASLGGRFGRPETSNLYLGYRMIEGPISSNILSAFMTYRMSEKWGINAGGQLDFGSTGNIGQIVDLVYIGESFLWQIGANYDAGRDNFGFRFGFEPRFTNRPRIFRPGGEPIPPASSKWLE